MSPGDLAGLLIAIGAPTLFFGYLFHRLFRIKERRMEIEAGDAAERAARYAAGNAELEARVRVLEKIVIDGGFETAAKIEALRETPARLPQGDKVQ